jgi:DNA-binding response OmpR family regulator/class 3 adenylate cyclase
MNSLDRGPQSFTPDDRSHRALLAHLRHELRTPLNAVIGYSEMLLEDVEDDGPESLIPDLQRVHAAGNQLLNLVNEILDPEKLEADLTGLDLETFGASLRHEMRTPLSAVIGYSEMLIEDAQDEGHQEIVPDLERIHQAGQRFLALIDDVVRFSAAQTTEADAGLETLAPAPNASAMVQDVVSSIRSMDEDAAARKPVQPGSILIVDDNETNRDLLARYLERQGHAVTLAQDGRQALELVGGQPFDLVLLDIMMPEVNGYEVLQRLKSHPKWHDIPVIMISALDEMDSVVRCIEMGAEDYLPKPFNPVLLRARTGASLEKKRLRDQEVEYMRNAALVADAAADVEAATFDPEDLAGVATRQDELGRLARVFQRMAREVHIREQRLKRLLKQLRLDMEEMRGGQSESLVAYLPMDRRHALARGERLPDRTSGAALFADISGFTPLTEALAAELGLQRGAEEVTRTINQVYGAMIDQVHRFGGSVIGFSGDAITCWFDGDEGLRAAACGLAMQDAMAEFASVTTPTGTPFSLAIKVAIATGPVRRFLVGDPGVQVIEVIAGGTLDRLARAEHRASRGQVLAEMAVVEQSGGRIVIAEQRSDEGNGQHLAVLSGLGEAVPASPWPELPDGGLTDAQCRAWMPPVAYERVLEGTGRFLSELRPATALFFCFAGIDYDGDDGAGARLDAFIRWVQGVLQRHGGSLFQLTMGDKGSYLCAAFGAPIAHDDDETRAVYAALDLQSPPPELSFVSGLQAGIAQGLMRTGAYGSSTRHIYSIQGDKANLAARLMTLAGEGILCDGAVYQAACGRAPMEPLPPSAVKGKAEPVPVYRVLPATVSGLIHSQIDQLSAREQLALKVASVIGCTFAVEILQAVYPEGTVSTDVGEHLRALERHGLIVRDLVEPAYSFRSAALHETVYNSMLFAQRRHLHRSVAEWYETAFADDLSPCLARLAHHWRLADEPANAVEYFERAGQQAMQAGAREEAERYFRESLELEAQAAVLSVEYPGVPDAD